MTKEIKMFEGDWEWNRNDIKGSEIKFTEDEWRLKMANGDPQLVTENEWREQYHRDVNEYIMDFMQDEVGDIGGLSNKEFFAKMHNVATNDNIELHMEKFQFVEMAKRLEALGIFPEQLLAENGVIPKRNNFPPVQFIRDLGYSYDGNGKIWRGGKVMKGGSDKTSGYVFTSIGGIPPESGYGGLSERRRKNGEKNNIMTIPQHILVFALHTGRWPRDSMVIDHIDDDKTNNHHENLREITYKENHFVNKGQENEISTAVKQEYKASSTLEECF